MLDHLESVFHLPNEIQYTDMTIAQQNQENNLDVNGNISGQYEDADDDDDNDENTMINDEE